MTNLTIHDVFDLPPDIPRCIVKIQDFDDEQTLRENINDYVITDTVAADMERLVGRIVASVDRQEAGEGHYLHGSFGSGKSHFMAILGLILENHPAVWGKEHPAIQSIRQRHQAWLAEHPNLVIPVYMLGQSSLQAACYNAANARLARLGKPACEFSDADNVIASFRQDAGRYGNAVYEQFQEATGISQDRFERMALADQAARDDLAQKILEHRPRSRAELVQLYPDKFSDGMARLTRHAQEHGFAGIVFLIDELILYLTGKAGREYMAEFSDLVALADNSALDRAAPLWVLVAKQRNIAETVPDDSSQQDVFEAMEHHKDRFPETTELADTELVPIVEERILKVAPGMSDPLTQIVHNTLTELPNEARDTLLADEFTLEDFRRVYPFHPALIRTLIDISARLSRERAAIRLLYELLIKRHPTLPVGELIPYASLFDVVFMPEGLTGGSRNEELEAVRQTYYERLAPLINDAYRDSEEKRRRAHLLTKTILLTGLSKTMKTATTVERLLHLNYQDLRGRTDFGSHQAIAGLLADLSNRSELVNFTPNPVNPAAGVASITLASGVQLADVLKRVPVTWRNRLDAFNGLIRDLLNKPIQNSEIPNYERVWRGTKRQGRVRFADIADLTANDMRVDDGREFTLFIDYPFDQAAAHARSEDLDVVQRARDRLPAIPVGFWLPAEFNEDDRRDLDEYAKMLELEDHPTQYLEEYGRSQREEIQLKLVTQRRTKADALRRRLKEVYMGPDASITFLDPTITPSLDAESLETALDRIADAVCDVRYPHHPKFATTLNQRTLGRLLDEFLAPAALGDGSVARNADLDYLLRSLAEPLDLAEQGAQKWTLRPQSRYLRKLEELATGKRIEADFIARGLTDTFGFTRELTDTFILYLIKGQGYRPLRGDRAAEANYGHLSGLILERGQRLAIHEWAQVKEFIQKTWQVRPAADELTVAAQDRLWNQVNTKAREVQRELNSVHKKLEGSLVIANVAVDQAPRLEISSAALDLNQLALNEDLDSYTGLQALLSWQPKQSQVRREAAAGQIAQRSAISDALDKLQTDTLDRIKTLARGGNQDANDALKRIRASLAATNEEADLLSHVLSWQREANGIIDSALKKPAAPEPKPGNGDSGDANKTLKDEPLIYIQSAKMTVGNHTRDLDTQTLEPVIRQLLQETEVKSGSRITIDLVLSSSDEP